VNAEDALERHPEAAKQVAESDRILLTKPGLTANSTPTSLLPWLHALAPRSPASPVANGEAPADWFFAANPLVTDPRPANLEACFDGLLTTRGADMPLAKGIINVRGMERPMVVHGVQHVFHPPEILDRSPDEDQRTRIVLITPDLDHRALQSRRLAAWPCACSSRRSRLPLQIFCRSVCV